MGSNPIPRTHSEPTALIEFGLWLLKRGNRTSTVERKLKYLKALRGAPQHMMDQVLASKWVDKSKSNAIDVVCQLAEYLRVAVEKPRFRVYQNSEIYVPNPEMVKQFLYRIRKVQLRAMVKIAIETGASSGEVWNLRWRDVNFQTKAITITGIKGHRTATYPISVELCALLMQTPKKTDRIFSNIKDSDNINDGIEDYRIRLAKETGNGDFRKVHFHTFRHYAISWFYFKTKDIVETQRFARHSNINNTLKYVHIIKAWIKENCYDVVYSSDKQEFSKYLSEGYELIEHTEWGYCLRKPKSAA